MPFAGFKFQNFREFCCSMATRSGRRYLLFDCSLFQNDAMHEMEIPAVNFWENIYFIRFRFKIFKKNLKTIQVTYTASRDCLLS